MDYEKKYKEALERARNLYKDAIDMGENLRAKQCEIIFPELAESEDERIRKALIEYFNEQCDMSDWNGVYGYQVVSWLEKQGERKPNPYSGTSFEYNGHIWGMCARDNGVEILFDGELKAFLSLEKSFIYPIHPQPSLMPKSAQETINGAKVEPKFKVGDKIRYKTNPEEVYTVDAVYPKYYVLDALGEHIQVLLTTEDLWEKINSTRNYKPNI